MNAEIDEPTEGSPRALMRRRQVLEAAGVCFRRHGFHGCSMAQIASQCGMSVGHIYRYFAGKDEIIKAIVLGNVEEVVSRFLSLAHAPADALRLLIDEVDEGVAKAADPERAALMLEVWAEAGRNPEVARTVQAADITLREHLARVVTAAAPTAWTPAEVAARVEMLTLLFEGISLRAVAHPDLDQAALVTMTRMMIERLLSPAP